MENTTNNASNFVSFIDANETCVMHTKTDHIEIMSGIKTNDAIY